MDIFETLAAATRPTRKVDLKSSHEKTIYLLKFALEVLTDAELQNTRNNDNWVIGRDIEEHIKTLESELEKLNNE